MAYSQAERNAYARDWRARNATRVNSERQALRLTQVDAWRSRQRRYNRKWRATSDYDARRDRTTPEERERSRRYDMNRRARKLAAPGNGVSKAEWQTIVEEYAGLCAYCGRPRRLTMDHIDPLIRGGAHDPENVAPACDSCNKSKCAKPLLIWLIDRRET